MKKVNKLLLIVISCFYSNLIFAQSIPVMKVAQLKQRIFQQNDSTYLVNFFATWCGPCMQEVPEFLAFAKQHQKEAVKVIFVSLDFKKEYQQTLTALLAKHQIKEELIFLDEPNPDFWVSQIDSSWTGEIPATLFLNHPKNIKQIKAQAFNLKELENQYQQLLK